MVRHRALSSGAAVALVLSTAGASAAAAAHVSLAPRALLGQRIACGMR